MQRWECKQTVILGTVATKTHLDELGAQGWELVSVFMRYQGGWETILFSSGPWGLTDRPGDRSSRGEHDRGPDDAIRSYDRRRPETFQLVVAEASRGEVEGEGILSPRQVERAAYHWSAPLGSSVTWPWAITSAAPVPLDRGEWQQGPSGISDRVEQRLRPLGAARRRYRSGADHAAAP